MHNPMSLYNKHVLVAGASSGIGRETAILASMMGAKVDIIARREEKLMETLSQMEGQAHAYSFDLTDLEGIEHLIQRIVTENGALDGMIFAAGIGSFRTLKMTKPVFMHNMMQTNFYPFMESVRVFTKKGNYNKGASIVGVSSVAAFRGDRSQSAYAASKAALSAVVHPIAKEIAGLGMRINAVAFGAIHTDMYENFLQFGGNEDTWRNQYLGIGTVKDAANVLCFLLSDASALITGSTLYADGGYLS